MCTGGRVGIGRSMVDLGVLASPRFKKALETGHGQDLQLGKNGVMAAEFGLEKTLKPSQKEFGYLRQNYGK